MTRKQIDQAREMRLWIRDIVVPALGIVVMVPEAREAVAKKFNDVKRKITIKMKK